MPRFHFNIFDGVTCLDSDGTQLSSVEEARRESLRLVSELLRQEASKEKLGSEWRLETTDGRGMILFRIDVMLSDSPALG